MKMKKFAFVVVGITFSLNLAFSMILNIIFINISEHAIFPIYFSSSQITISVLESWRNLGLLPILISGELLETIFLMSFIYLMLSILISHKKEIGAVDLTASIYIILQFLILIILDVLITYFVFTCISDNISLIATQFIGNCYLTSGYINLITYPVILLYSTGAIIIQIRYKFFLKSVVHDKFRTLTSFKSLDHRIIDNQDDFKAWYDLAEFFSFSDQKLALACVNKCLKIKEDYSKGIILQKKLEGNRIKSI